MNRYYVFIFLSGRENEENTESIYKITRKEWKTYKAKAS
jgi:hypothetical protein